MTKGKQVADARERKTDEIQRALETIVGRYTRARAYEAFGKRNPLWAEFERVASALKGSDAVLRFPHIVIRWSAGQGRWATVPWIAALDSRETSKTSEGVYVIYLFRADMSGVYLTLNQGTSWVMAGYGGRGSAQLRDRAAQLRTRSGSLKAAGFDVSEGIDLKSDVPLIRGYQDSTPSWAAAEAARREELRVQEISAQLADVRETRHTQQLLLEANRTIAQLRNDLELARLAVEAASKDLRKPE